MTLLSILLSIVVSAQIDSATIKLGDQTKLHLHAVAPQGEQVGFPVYSEQIAEDLEIVSVGPIDTVQNDNGQITYSQDYLITSFKDSLFYIAPLPFTHGSDTIFTNDLSLNVIQPFTIDTTQNTLADIKPIYAPKFWWWGLIRWILLGLGIAGLGVGAYFLYRKYRQMKAAASLNEEEKELLRPAHEVALEKLDQIKAEKIWQQGLAKEYYTQVTDVLREYISRQFGISSQEQTSNEILSDIRPLLAERKDLFAHLKQLLQLADLVKFAKWNAMPDENEISLLNAYEFVNETTPAEEPQEIPNEKTDQQPTE